MAAKHWRLVVSDISGSDSIGEVTVEAKNWMAAIKAGRAELGEDGGVPTGSSCAVASDGKVTILDPVDRRRYVLMPDTSTTIATSKKASAPRVPADDVPRPSEPAPAAAPATKKKKVSKRTMAYSANEMPDELKAKIAAHSAQAAPAKPAPAKPAPAKPVASQPAAKKKVSKNTMAYSANDVSDELKAKLAAHNAQAAPAPAKPAPAKPAPAKPVPVKPVPVKPVPAKVAVPKPLPVPEELAVAKPVSEKAVAARPGSLTPSPAPQPAAPPQPVGPVWRLLHQRDEKPSEKNPLRYIERIFVMPEDSTQDDAEAMVRARLTELREELVTAAKGKFVNLAIFDHEWDAQPRKPPIVALQWKDWRDEVTVTYPLADHRASQPQVPMRARRAVTDEHDARLAKAFEACQDLHFLESPAAGLDFVVKLLTELLPCEALSAVIYDINANELRFLALDGPGAEVMRGKAIAPDTGILGAATHVIDAVVKVDDASKDARYDADADGRPGVEVRSLMYISLTHQSRLLGAIQAINPAGGKPFRDADADLLVYIGKQASNFLYQQRIAERRPSA